MKTVILAGTDNLVFSAADMIDPKEYKVIGFATTIQQAWNIYDENGEVKEQFDELPVMPLEASVGFEPELLILVASTEEDETRLKFMLYHADYRGDVRSLFDNFKGISQKTALIRRMAWRLEELGVKGAVADLGAYRGDISWQMNALMPERKLYLFDTFTGYDARDVAKEQELGLSDARTGQYGMSEKERKNLDYSLLSRMPYPEQIVIKKGWFPETAYALEDETYALAYLDTGLYAPTYSGIQYFYPRLAKGGVMIISGFSNGKTQSVRRAVEDLELQYGAFLYIPLCDKDGTIVIMKP